MCSLPSKFDSVLKAFDEQFPCLRTKYNSNLSSLCVQTDKLLNSKLIKLVNIFVQKKPDWKMDG